TTPSSSTVLSDAMVEDLAKLGGIVSRAAGQSIVFIAAPEQALAIALWSPMFDYPVLASSALTAKTVIAVASNALVSGFDPVPSINASYETEVHMETSPAEIVSPGGAVAVPVASIYQKDSIALRMLMPCAWALRASGAIAYMNAVNW